MQENMLENIDDSVWNLDISTEYWYTGDTTVLHQTINILQWFFFQYLLVMH